MVVARAGAFFADGDVVNTFTEADATKRATDPAVITTAKRETE